MIPEQAFLDLEELLSAADTGRDIHPESCDWSADLAAACSTRLATEDVDRRKRIIRLLDRMAAADAKAVLLEYLPKATEADVADVLSALCDAGIKAPADCIEPWIDRIGIPAIAAAGLSGDLKLVPKLESLLPKPETGWHAALALAMLGARPSAEKIAARIAASKGLERTGFIVALEVMDEPAVIPVLRDLLSSLEGNAAWDLGHALWRLTGREPLVPLGEAAQDPGQAIASAWHGYDLDAVLSPRLDQVAFEPEQGTATFAIRDGTGQVRVDCDPPQPGSSWPRWYVSVYLGQQRLYTVESPCDTCETTLKLAGMPADRASLTAASVREALAASERPTPALLQALAPVLTKMRTGHHLARVVDLDLEWVTLPERSWLTRRLVYRIKSAGSFCDPGVIQWPGVEHFQVLRPALDDVPTYGLVLPTAPLGKLDPATMARYEDSLRRGERPAALLLAWLEDKNVASEFPERFLVSVVLDGHHKLMAYHRQGIPARCLIVSRVEDCAGPAGDRARWLQESLRGLQHAPAAQTRS